MVADVRIVVHHDAIAALGASQMMRRAILAAAAPVVTGARARAPRLSGRGAASIHAEAVLDGGAWNARVSWSRTAFYLYFHERGTRRLGARPFLVPALEEAAS